MTCAADRIPLCHLAAHIRVKASSAAQKHAKRGENVCGRARRVAQPHETSASKSTHEDHTPTLTTRLGKGSLVFLSKFFEVFVKTHTRTREPDHITSLRLCAPQLGRTSTCFTRRELMWEEKKNNPLPVSQHSRLTVGCRFNNSCCPILLLCFWPPSVRQELL